MPPLLDLANKNASKRLAQGFGARQSCLVDQIDRVAMPSASPAVLMGSLSKAWPAG
jgi:hypothetical protein